MFFQNCSYKKRVYQVKMIKGDLIMKPEINEKLLNCYEKLRKFIKVSCVNYFVKLFYVYFRFM